MTTLTTTPGASSALDDDVKSVLGKWAHNVKEAGESKQKPRTIRLELHTEEDFKKLEELIMANMNWSAKPPKILKGNKGKIWTIVDSGSEPTVADCEKHFPGHVIRESDAQRKGVLYKGADGSLIPNQGEVRVTHRAADGQTYQLTFQNAKVHTPILSIRQMVDKDCIAVFHKQGGWIEYPDGRKLKFICRGGVFFMLLNVDEPDFHRHGQA